MLKTRNKTINTVCISRGLLYNYIEIIHVTTITMYLVWLMCKEKN